MLFNRIQMSRELNLHIYTAWTTIASDHFYYEYHYDPHKLAFQSIMRAGDQKLMINLEWPNTQVLEYNNNYYTRAIYTTAIDQCETAVCADDATCFPLPGSFECRCNEGFEGDGTTGCTFVQLGKLHQS